MKNLISLILLFSFTLTVTSPNYLSALRAPAGIKSPDKRKFEQLRSNKGGFRTHSHVSDLAKDIESMHSRNGLNFEIIERVLKNYSLLVNYQGIELPAVVAFVLPLMVGSLGKNHIGDSFRNNNWAKELFSSPEAIEAAKADLIQLIKEAERKKGQVFIGRPTLLLSSFVEIKESDEIVKAIPLSDSVKKTVVELGACLGWLSAQFSKKYKHNKYIAIEKDEEIVAIVKNRIRHQNIDYRIGDATNLKEFADQTIDILLDKQLIDMVALVRKGELAYTLFKHLEEASRTLKKDGLYYKIVDPEDDGEIFKNYMPAFGFELVEEKKVKGILVAEPQKQPGPYVYYTLLKMKKVIAPLIKKPSKDLSISITMSGNEGIICLLQDNNLKTALLPIEGLKQLLEKLGKKLIISEDTDEYNFSLAIVPMETLVKIGKKLKSGYKKYIEQSL